MDERALKIGEAAGLVWRTLEGRSEGLTAAQLKARTSLDAELLHQAIGWLAREGKIGFRAGGKSLKVVVR